MPGERYYWVSKAALALTHFTGLSSCALLTKDPHKPEDYHRVRVVVVRTKEEAARDKRKWDRVNKNFLRYLEAKNFLRELAAGQERLRRTHPATSSQSSRIHHPLSVG